MLPRGAEYFGGAIVVDGLYNGLYLPFRLKIENREDRKGLRSIISRR